MKCLLATSVFAAGAYTLILLAGTPVASADAPAGVVATPPSAVMSPATAALVDGDDIRARFIFDPASNRLTAATEATAAPDIAALSPATAALADGDDIRARALAAIQH